MSSRTGRRQPHHRSHSGRTQVTNSDGASWNVQKSDSQGETLAASQLDSFESPQLLRYQDILLPLVRKVPAPALLKVLTFCSLQLWRSYLDM